jgi:hypothetical protein
MLRFLDKTIMSGTIVFVLIPLTSHAENSGPYISLGATGIQTESSYKGGEIAPRDIAGAVIAPSVSVPISANLVGDSKSQAAITIDAGYDFGLTDTVFVGAFFDFNSSKSAGGNKSKVVGSGSVVSSTATVNGASVTSYRILDNRYEVATQDELGASYTIGAKIGASFDSFSVAALVGYSAAEAKLGYGIGFDKTFGSKFGVTTTTRTVPAFSPDAPIIARASETLSGVKYGIEGEYSLSDNWSAVVSASTVDYGDITVNNPTGGGKLTAEFKRTEGSVRLRMRY